MPETVGFISWRCIGAKGSPEGQRTTRYYNFGDLPLIDVPTAAAWLDDIKADMNPLTLGNHIQSGLTFFTEYSLDTVPTDEDALRGKQIVVTFKDTVNNKTVLHTIPAYQKSGVVVTPQTGQVDLTDGNMAAWVSEMEAHVKSSWGNSIVAVKAFTATVS